MHMLRFTRKHSEVSLARIFLHVQLWSLILKMSPRAESSSLLEGRWPDSQPPSSWKGPSETQKSVKVRAGYVPW